MESSFWPREVEGGGQSPPESSSAERRVSVSGLPQPHGFSWDTCHVVTMKEQGAALPLLMNANPLSFVPKYDQESEVPGAARHAALLVDS